MIQLTDQDLALDVLALQALPELSGLGSDHAALGGNTCKNNSLVCCGANTGCANGTVCVGTQ